VKQCKKWHLRRTRPSHFGDSAAFVAQASRLRVRPGRPHHKRQPFVIVRANPPLWTRFPRGATFNIVGPKCPADVNVGAPNNIENGTSTAHWLSERVSRAEPG
jgi:hypothetical protein